MKIAPSILSADFANLQADVKKVEQAGANYLHIDIMDGHFVDNLTFGPLIVKALRPKSNLVFDCHLMVSEPEKYLVDLAEYGADIIGVHVEATKHIHRVLSKIKALHKKCEVVVNPGTPITTLIEVLPLVDQVLVMSVDPGFGGQAFLDTSLKKVEQLVKFRQAHNLAFEIEIDGGINEITAPKALQAGVDVLVAGSYIFGAKDPKKSIVTLKNYANS